MDAVELLRLEHVFINFVDTLLLSFSSISNGCSETICIQPNAIYHKWRKTLDMAAPELKRIKAAYPTCDIP